jgi:hypothetical protein
VIGSCQTNDMVDHTPLLYGGGEQGVEGEKRDGV